MRDLRIAGGDIVLGGGALSLVDGTAYIRQRIATALAEPYGSDPFQPTWGSTLESYLGSPITPGTDALVASETARVLAQLIAAQQAMITGWSLTGAKAQLLADDTIAAVTSVNAYVSADPEMIVVRLSLVTQGGQQLALSRTVALTA
jgi:phage baseplate assembly protein W